MSSEMSLKDKLKRIKAIEGVVGCVAFEDGMPVEKAGSSLDVEQLAALSESLVRSTNRFCNEVQVGTLRDIILETDSKKILIYPTESLWLCVVVEKDVNLGILRLLLDNIL